MPIPAKSLRNWILLVLIAGAYFIAGKLGLKLAFVNASATAVWPPTGLALSAFLIFGYPVWPAIFAGAFLTNITTAGSIITSAAIAVGNTLEGLAGAYLINRFAAGRNVFKRPQDIFKFAILGGLVSTTISAAVGVTTLLLGGLASWSGCGNIWLTWWLGDASGALIVAPVLLLWSENFQIKWRKEKFIDAVLLISLPILIGTIVFGSLLPLATQNYPIDFLCLPILIWAAFRFSRRETALVSFIISAIAAWGTFRGFGPFVRKSPNESLLLLQVFMGITTVTALAVSAVIDERRLAEKKLRQARVDLESQVQERTEQLSKTVWELQNEINLRSKAEAELLRSNTELEQFATVAAHELQEPVRKILTFGDLIKTLNPDEETWQYIQKMEQAANRMQRLVQDILHLSRVTTNAKPLITIDLKKIAADVAADFIERVSLTGGKIEIKSMPTVRADELQMRQLLANLISNAYKFRKKDEPLNIDISSLEPSGGFVKILIEDNGIGFEEEYLDRIFKPFQRLHPRGEYEGSGMGLAICRRILMRHGGDITAKSSQGKGSVFIISLPELAAE